MSLLQVNLLWESAVRFPSVDGLFDVSHCELVERAPEIPDFPLRNQLNTSTSLKICRDEIWKWTSGLVYETIQATFVCSDPIVL